MNEIEEYKKTVRKWDNSQLFTSLSLLLSDSPDGIAILETIEERMK